MGFRAFAIPSGESEQSVYRERAAKGLPLETFRKANIVLRIAIQDQRFRMGRFIEFRSLDLETRFFFGQIRIFCYDCCLSKEDSKHTNPWLLNP